VLQPECFPPPDDDSELYEEFNEQFMADAECEATKKEAQWKTETETKRPIMNWVEKLTVGPNLVWSI
jgi:hypothetical protein